VIRCAYDVRRQLRPGLAEVLYRRALVLELEEQRLSVKTEVPYAVWYRGQVIGTYRADVVVDERIIVEVKHVDRLVQAHRDQLHNYLRIAELRVGLLVNFGVRSEVRRVENWQFGDSVPPARLMPMEGEGIGRELEWIEGLPAGRRCAARTQHEGKGKQQGTAKIGQKQKIEIENNQRPEGNR